MDLRNRTNQTAVKVAVCITLTALFLPGCAGETSSGDGGLMRYAAADASYTAEFASGDGDAIVCACERSGGTTVLRVTSPERLNGLSVRYDGNACSLGAGETSILLSADAASGLTEIFDLLARTDGTPAKSADGTQTVVTFENGTVTVGADGVPVEVTLDERVVKIVTFTMADDSYH